MRNVFRNKSICILAICLALLCILKCTVSAATGAFRSAKRSFVICIDPGHGGDEDGAKYMHNGMEICEKDLNLSISLFLRDELLTYQNVTVVMTRDSDVSLEPAERSLTASVNQADIFISIHNNANSAQPSRGCMVLCDVSDFQAPLAKYPSNYSISDALGRKMLNNLSGLGLLISTDMDDFGGNMGIVHRPYSEDGGASTTRYYEDGSVADYYYQLRFTTEIGIPGVVIEHAYVSSDEDYEDYLSTDVKLKALAMADANAIAEMYQLTKKPEN